MRHGAGETGQCEGTPTAMLMTIRLELAHDADFPRGNPHRGYVFLAPIDREGRIDVARWEKAHERCLVTRFHDGETKALGTLTLTPGGEWAFEEGLGDDGEPRIYFAEHDLRPGETLVLSEGDAARTYRVVSVSAAVF